MDCVAEHVEPLDAESEPARRALGRRYFITVDDLTPRVFYRLTDNWLELTVRFIVHAHGVRDIKVAVSRAVLKKFDDTRIEIASATYEIVGAPTLRVQSVNPQ
jgi:hypothetical protein